MLAPGIDGFVHADGMIFNPSYAVMPALDALRRARAPLAVAGHPRRDAAGPAGTRVSARRTCRVDWVRVDGAGAMWTDPDRPPRFGFDAVRVPLYLCWSGRCGDAAVEPVKRWWSSFRAAGKPSPAWIDVRTGEVAPFAASVGMASVADLALTGRRLDSVDRQ
ncbi:glycosyl hydrolase family 8 [Caulobacter segnis]